MNYNSETIDDCSEYIYILNITRKTIYIHAESLRKGYKTRLRASLRPISDIIDHPSLISYLKHCFATIIAYKIFFNETKHSNT